MKQPSLSSDFNALRKSKHLTLLEIANLCDLNESTVHKVGSGKTVRWETLHLILSVGMKVYPGTTEYESIHRLWILQRENIAAGNTPEKGSKKMPKHEATAGRDFRKMITGLDQRQVKLLMQTVRRKVNTLRAE